MKKEAEWDALCNEDLAKLAMDMFYRIIVHHTLWFMEVEHQMGMQEALEVMDTAYRKSFNKQMQRLSKFLGFEMENGVPNFYLVCRGKSCSNLLLLPQ